MNADDFNVSTMMLRLFAHVAESIVVADHDGRIMYANPVTEKYGGKPIEEIKGRLLWDVYPASAGLYEDEFRRAVREQVRVSFEFYFPPTDGWLEVRFDPSPDAVAIFSAEITESKRAEEVLRERNAFIERVTDLMPTMLYVYNIQTNTTIYANKQGAQLLGYTQEQFREIGVDISRALMHPDDLEHLHQQGEQWRTVQDGEIITFEYRMRHNSGKWRWFFSRDMVLERDAEGLPLLIIGTAEDITERKRNEEALYSHQQQIESLNARLRRAMAETHHRVKNNLQVIASLVEMQAADMENTVMETPLLRINQHVQALAIIHDLLTQQAKTDADMEHIGTQSIMDTLLPLLGKTIGNHSLAADIDEIILTAEKAASFALLVSECVSNAVKHGRGEIEITLKREDHTAKLEICDDGDGFPFDFDPRQAANTGLQLIESAARWDLRGDVRYDNRDQGGGRVIVTFPIKMSG